MALNRKIKEETPQKVLDLLRETRTGTNSSPSVAQSENPVSASPWRNFGTGSVAGEDSLLQKVRQYNQQRQQQEERIQNAQTGLRRTYNIGNAPEDWDKLSNRERAYFNYYDPEHKLYNFKSNTNFAPVNPNQHIEQVRDENGQTRATMVRGANPYLFQQNMNRFEDNLVNKLWNGEYDDRDADDPDVHNAYIALNKRFHGTDEYRNAARMLAANGGAQLNQEQRDDLMQNYLNQEVNKRVNALSLQNYATQEQRDLYGQNTAQSRVQQLTNTDPTTYEGQKRRAADELLQAYHRIDDEYDEKAKTSGVDPMGIEMDRANAKRAYVDNYRKTITNNVRQRSTQGANEAYVIEIGQMIKAGQRLEAAETWHWVREGILDDIARVDALLEINPRDNDAKQARQLLEKELADWNQNVVMFNDDFVEKSQPKQKEKKKHGGRRNRDNEDTTDKGPTQWDIINNNYDDSGYYIEASDNRWGRYIHNEERDIYNYLYNTKGAQAASAYLNSINNRLLFNRSKQYSENVAALAEQYPAAAAVWSIVATPVEAAAGTVGAITGQNPYSGIFSFTRAKNTARGTVRNMISDSIQGNKAFMEILDMASNGHAQDISNAVTGAMTFAYDALMSSGDSFVATSIGGLLAGAAGVQAGSKAAQALGMGLSLDAYQNAYLNYTTDGVNPTDANFLAIMTGALEFTTEMVGMEWATRGIKADANNMHIILRAATCGGIAEALEEAPGAVAMTLIENALLGSESQMNKAIGQRMMKYQSEGMGTDEARARAAREVYAETALNILYEMGVAGASGGVHAGTQVAIDLGGGAYGRAITEAVASGQITAEQGEILIAANQNLIQTRDSGNESLLNQNLQEQAKTIQQEWQSNLLTGQLTDGMTSEMIDKAAANQMARINMEFDSETVPAAEPVNPAGVNQDAIAEQNAREADWIRNREAAAAAEDQRNQQAMQNNANREAAERAAAAEAEEQRNREAENAAIEQRAEQQRQNETRAAENQPEAQPLPVNQGARIRGLERLGYIQSREDATARNQQAKEEAAQERKELEDQKKMYKRELKDAKKRKSADRASMLETALAHIETRLSGIRDREDALNQETQMIKSLPDSAFQATEAFTEEQQQNATAVPTLNTPAIVNRAQENTEEQEEKPQAETAEEAQEEPKAEQETAKEKLPTPKELPKRRKPRITQEELATYWKAKKGLVHLNQQEMEDLTDKYGELMYFFDNKPYGTEVRVGKQNVKIEGFASSGKNATVNVTETDKDGKTVTKTVPLREVNFGDHIGVSMAYENAAAYTDTDTARNYLAGFERTSADPYNYRRGFEGIYSEAISGKAMTAEQAASANMIEPGIQAMIRAAGQRARSQMAEELGIDGEANSEMTKAEQGIARAGTEEANSRTYTGVVRDFSGKMNAKQRANMHALHWIAKNAGMKITLTDKAGRYLTRKGSIDENAGLNGFFRTGTNEAVIDIHAMDGAAVITAFHEAWHFVKQEAKHNTELAEKVSTIEGILDKHLSSLPSYDKAQRIQEVQALYKRAGQDLTEDEALEEIYADALRGVADRGLITQFKNATGTQTVLDKIHSVLDKWKGYLNKAVRSLGESSAEVRAVLKADEETLAKLSNGFRMTREVAGRVYAERTQGQETSEEAGDRYSIQELNDGSKYVLVDTDQHLFDNAPESQYTQIAVKYMREHFRGTVIGEGQNKAYVSSRSINEYAHPAKQRGLSEKYYQKMRASTELDNMVNAGRFIRNKYDKRHPEYPGGFDLYDLTIAFDRGQNKTPYVLEGVLNIGIRENGGREFYDFTQLNEIDPAYWVKQHKAAAQSIGQFLDNNIQQTDEKVKAAFEADIRDTEGAETHYGDAIKLSLRVTDPETTRFLENQEHIKTYKTMKLLDGKLYPPKATLAGRGQMEDYSVLGQWEQAVEHPEWIKKDKNGNPVFDLVENGSKTTTARYNPYMHSSNLMINDQFSGAYNYGDEGSKLGRFVTVECEVPSSEATSGYHAEYAKDSTGWHAWHAGPVAGAIHQAKGEERQVFLSRWIKPVRIVPDAEVAQHYKKLLKGTDVQVPDNVVPPSLLKALREAGVPIKESGRVKYSLNDETKQPTQQGSEWENKVNSSTEAVETGTQVDVGTQSAYSDMRLSLTTYKESEYNTNRDKMVKMIMEATNRDEQTVSKWLDDVNGIAAMIAADKTRLDYMGLRNAAGELVNSALKSNAEYGGSIDMSLICAKRRLMTGTIDAIQRRLGNSGFLTAEEMMKVRQMLLKHKYQAACGLCYVESSRKNMGKLMNEFRREFQAAHQNDGTYIPSMADIKTVEGLADLQIHHPDVYEALVKHMNKMAQRKPKMYEMRTEYNGEILKRFANDDTVGAKNEAGGLRINSFSDFEIVHLIDMMQVIMDMSAVGLAGQAYTKVPDFAKALGATGLKINLSLIAKRVGKDGRIVFDDVEGMDHKEAFKIREQYSDNVGTILVVFTEQQLRAAVNDPRIDFIIPFHRSQWKKADYPNLGLAKDTMDFTMHQNERWIHPSRHLNQNGKKTRPANFAPNSYWDFSKTGKENAEEYLRKCAEDDRQPKFAKFLVNNGDGSWSLPADGSMDGYWKLLIDFKMYNNEGEGRPQMPVQPNFNKEESERMLKEYKGGHESFPVANDVVDEFLKDREKTFGVKYSLADVEEAAEKAFPNSKVRDADGKLLKMYHGTGAEFTEFKRDRIGSTGRFEGSGFNFTPYEGRASSYGKNVLAGYLNIEKPLSAEKKTISLAKLAKIIREADPTGDNIIADYARETRDYGKPSFVQRESLTAARSIWDSSDNDVDIYSFISSADSDAEGLIAKFEELGYDGLIHYDDNGNIKTAVAFSSHQFKLADEVTRDDNGKEIPLSERFNTKSEDIRYSLADRQYRDAVKNGDTALADQMVERAARRAGYTLKVTHRTNAEFNVFDKTKRSGKNGKSLGDGFYVAELKDGRRSEYDSDAYGKNRIVAYVDPGNVFNLAKGLSEEQAEYVYDKYFAPFHEDRFGTYKPHVIDKLQSSTRLMDYIIEAAETNDTTTDEIFKDLGYDSIKDGPQYAIFDSNQIKRADTATYDDDGELIPLSERFNPEKEDIRYSLSDPAVEEAADGIRWSFGTELTDEDGNSEMAQLLNENERLQAENQRLRNGVETARALNENRQMRELMQQVTTQINQWRNQDGPDAKQIARMARDVREALETTVPYEDLKQDLTSVFQSMSKAKTPTESKAAMQALSDLMLHCAYNSRHADKSDYEQYADERATIKSVSPRAWKEICADVGMEWNYFRRTWGPKLGWIKNRRTMTEDGASIDSAWQELNEMNPGTFSDDTLALGDKAAAMLAFMDNTAIHYYNPHTEENPMNRGVDTATYAASDMAMKLLYDYMTNGHEVKGSDQQRMARITELMDQTMTAIRENRGRSEGTAPASWQKKMDEMKRRIREERSAGYQRARDARADERARQQDIRMRQAERRAEMEDRRKTIGEINRKRASLLKKLEHPSSSGWVPTAMRDSVTKLLTALDFENEITGEQAFTEDLLKEAKAAYESINKGEGPDGARGPMASYYNGDLVNTFDKLIETAAGKKASQLTDEEMSEIRDIVSGFAAAVINADTMFTTARSESVHDMGDTMIEQSNERRNRLGEHRVQGKLGQWLSTALSRGLLKPTTVYGEYEGTVIGDIYKRLRAAEFQHIRNVTEAEEFFQDLINKYHMQSVVNQESSEGRSRHLDRIRRHSKSFRLSSGQTVNLTTQELMTLYAWQKREGMMETNHLLGGGFTLRNQAKGGSTAEYRVNSGDLAQFNAALTEDQKKFVDEMVKYLSTTVGGWGNEVTEILYGLSKFTESYYLPFTVNKNYVGQDPAQAQDARIKVASFTKDLTRNASTTLELAPFMTLWASHVEQMSDFNAFTLPIEDMVRVMNYRQSLYDDEGKFAGYGESVRPRMQQAWGRNSTDYIYSFLARLNGNSRQEHGGSWINRFMGTAKGAAVTFNLSVAAQQMGAGIRAMAEMNPIDVAKGIAKGLNVVRVNKQYEELMQYAPIAIEKSWGYFDTNMKSGLYDRQRKTAWNWVEDKGGKLAEFGDMFNWVQIWQACKSEAQRQNKGADAETIKQKAGERFAEVIDRTQVVDSVFQRAEWATEKGMMKNLMAFMSEPITMYNMLYRSATDFGRAIKTKQGAAKAFGKLTRNVAAIGMSGALTALLKSLITGLRNRDDEKKDEEGNIIGRKTYWDKVQESWGGNMIDNLLGVGTVFSSAIQDVAGTYRSSNSLTDAWIGNLYDAGKELIKGLDGTSEPNYEKAFYKALQGVSSLCGVGFASLYRDSKALIDTAKEEFTDMMVAADAYDDSKSLEERLSVATQTMAYTEDHKGPGMKKKPGFYTDLLLDVYMKHGLGAEFEQVADAAISVGATAKGLQTSFRNKLSAAEDRVPAAAKAMADGDTETYNRLVHELLEYGIGSKIINSMIESEYKKLVNTEEEPKEPGTGEDLIGKLKEGDEGTSLLTTRADNLLDNLSTRDQVKEAVSLYKQDGLSEDKIAGKLSGKYKNSYIAACINGDTAEQKRLQQILTVQGGGITAADLKKWTTEDLFDSSSKAGLYYHILNGDTDAAKKTAQWLYRNVEGGQQTVKDKVTKWAKNRTSRGTATDWQTVRAVLKAMGFSQDTIDKCCGK